MGTAIRRNTSKGILSDIQQVLDEPGHRDFRIACSDGPVYVAKFLLEAISRKSFLLAHLAHDDSSLIIPDVSKSIVANFFENILSAEHCNSNLLVSGDILSGLSWINWEEWQRKEDIPVPILTELCLTGPSLPAPHPIEPVLAPSQSTTLPKDLKPAPSKFPRKKKDSTVVKSAKCTCTKCGKALCDKFSLKKHVDTVHLNIHPFECLVCQKRFILKGDLETHATNVHDKKKVAMMLCNIFFIIAISFSSIFSLRF